MGENGGKWGKMGKEFYGESILGLAIFPIFPHLKKNFEKKNFRKRKSAQGWGKMGKNGGKWGKNFMGKAF